MSIDSSCMLFGGRAVFCFPLQSRMLLYVRVFRSVHLFAPLRKDVLRIIAPRVSTSGIDLECSDIRMYIIPYRRERTGILFAPSDEAIATAEKIGFGPSPDRSVVCSPLFRARGRGRKQSRQIYENRGDREGPPPPPPPLQSSTPFPPPRLLP